MTFPAEQLTFDGMAPSPTASATIVHVTLDPMPLPFHPLADLFPLLKGAEFDVLVADIEQHGVLEPVWLYEGQVLDGRNRYRACQALDIDCPSRTYDGNDPLEFVLSLNLRRRHLNESQRAIVAQRLANMRQGERTDIEPSANLQKVSIAQAASLLNVSERTVHEARKVQQQGASEIIKAIDDGEMTIAAALPLTALPKDDQPQALDEAKRAASGKKVTAAVTASVVQQRQGGHVAVASLPPNGQAPEPAPSAVEATPVPTLDTLFSTASAVLRSLTEALRLLTLEERLAAGPEYFLPQLKQLLILLIDVTRDTPAPSQAPYPKPVSSHKGRKKAKKRSIHKTHTTRLPYGEKKAQLVATALTFPRFSVAQVTQALGQKSAWAGKAFHELVKNREVFDGKYIVHEPGVELPYVWVTAEASQKEGVRHE